MNPLGKSSPDYTDSLNRVAVFIFFIWVAIFFSMPVGEGDFFWHVKTGQWIWEHKSLPTADPFSFTVKDINPFNPESKRIPFLLKQYWLGQMVFYGIWNFAGEAGMVIFRSFCFTGILWFLYRWARRYQQGIVPLLTVMIAAKVLLNYSSERPQIFGFILMPVLLFILEQIRTSRTLKSGLWPAFTLPLVMLLWSNCHGSFILGIVIIALYAASHVIDRIRGREPLNSFSLLIMSAAIMVTLINPNGYGAFTNFFSVSKNYTNLVAEYKSPLMLAFKYHAIDYFYWLLVAAALLTAIIHIKQIKTAHLLVIFALMGLSLSGTRYIPFFVMAAPLLCMYIPEWRPKKANFIFNLLPVLIILIIMATADYSNILKFRAERGFPLQAAKFLREVKPTGNMFNYVGWGGYLMCYSDHPVFIDGRHLVQELLPLHDRILFGVGWQELLEQYKINFIIIPGTEAITLKAYPLLLQLLGDDSWALVYQDEVALVLVKNRAENSSIIKNFGLDKSAMTEHIQARWQWQTTNSY